jgi:hypothetical protein
MLIAFKQENGQSIIWASWLEIKTEQLGTEKYSSVWCSNTSYFRKRSRPPVPSRRSSRGARGNPSPSPLLSSAAAAAGLRCGGGGPRGQRCRGRSLSRMRWWGLLGEDGGGLTGERRPGRRLRNKLASSRWRELGVAMEVCLRTPRGWGPAASAMRVAQQPTWP